MVNFAKNLSYKLFRLWNLVVMSECPQLMKPQLNGSVISLLFQLNSDTVLKCNVKLYL